MDDSGLGTLVSLPQEVRDIIYSLLRPEGLHKPMLQGQGRPFFANSERTELVHLARKKICSTPYMLVSKRFFSEFLHVYLRESCLEEWPQYGSVQDLVDFTRPYLPHGFIPRGLGIAIVQTLRWGLLLKRVSPNSDIWARIDMQKHLKSLQTHHELLQIPLKKLFIHHYHKSPRIELPLDSILRRDYLDQERFPGEYRFKQVSVKIWISDQDASVRELVNTLVRVNNEFERYLHSAMRMIAWKCLDDGERLQEEKIVRDVVVEARKDVLVMRKFYSHLIRQATDFSQALEDRYRVKDLFDLAEKL